jgi:hypothetical protein
MLIFYFQKNRHMSGGSPRIVTGVGYLGSDSLSTLEIDPRQKSRDPLAAGYLIARITLEDTINAYTISRRYRTTNSTPSSSPRP